MKKGFRGAPRPLLPAMLLVATNPNAGQEHDAVAPSQPSSSTPPVPSTSSPPVITTPTPIPATIPSPTPIPETEPEPFKHIFEEPSPVHQRSSPPQKQAQRQMAMDDLLQVRTSGRHKVQTLLKKPKNSLQVASLKPRSIEKGRNTIEEKRLSERRKEEEAKQIHLDSHLAPRIGRREELNEATEEKKKLNFNKATPKRLKDDEAKDDESTKKSGKRRKQMARRGMAIKLDKDEL
ncbi:hypothetical protein Tco_0461582 [Tanacetum coccineum]